MGGTLYTFNGGGTNGTWTDPSIWTTDPTGSTLINSRVPANGDAVVVTNSFVVYVSSAIATTGLDLTIQRGGVLDLQSAAATFATLNSLSGQGTLRIAAPYFPTITTNNFDKINTGTVEFYNWATGPTALPIPASGLYNNLRLLNTSTAAFGVLLDANLTVNGSFALSRTNTTTFPAGSTYATPAAAATGAAISFKIGLSAASRTLNVYNTMTVGNGTFFGVNNVNNGVHVLNAYADFINNGTVNLRNTTDGQAVQVAFRGASNANFACNGDTDLDILVVDKGIDSQVLLNITSAVGLHGSAQGNLRLNHTGAVDILQLFNGVTKLGNNVYLAKISNDLNYGFSLGEEILPAGSGVHNSPTLWIAGATVANDNEPLIAVYGIYRISSGQFTCKNDAGMVVREAGQVLVEGGLTQVNKFRPSRTSANHRGSFIISGGVFECTGTTPTSVDDQFARFCVPYITQGFRMTGGTIRTQAPNPNGIDGIFHIGVAPNNAIVTGGTIEIILPASNINGKILSTAPLWNMTIKKSGSAGTSKVINQTMPFDPAFAPNATTAGQPLTVQNDFTFDATNPTTFDAGSLDLTIQGAFTINTGCTYLTGTNLTVTNNTIFSGTQNQLLTNNGTIGTTAGTGTFSNWTVNKAAGILTLAGSVNTYITPVGTTLSILQGVLNDAGKTINVQGNIVNSAFHQSVGTGSITMNGAGVQTIGGDGTGAFGNLKVFNTGLAAGSVAVTLANSIAVSNQLTLQSTHVFAIGAYRLSLTNVNIDALLPTNGFSSQRMIQTAGNASDLGLQKTYGGANAFTFPVGTGTKYTPAIVDLQLATGLSQYGQVSVSPANMRSPFVASTTNSLAYYWKVRSVGFGTIPSGAVKETFTMTNTDAAGYTQSPNNYIGGRYLPTAWNTTFSPAGSISSFGATSDIVFSGMQQFDGEFTAGQSATFGPITSFYSRANGNWETNTTWSTTSNSGTAVSAGAVAGTNYPGPGNPVFIGAAASSINHTVTVTAANAKSGSLVIDNGSTLDLQGFTGHNFGALPDSKPGGSGTMRITAPVVKSGPNYLATPAFPSGDFGSFLQAGGGTVEYYGSASANAYTFSVPTTSASSLSLNSYEYLTLNPVSNGEIILPDLNLRIYNQLKVGTTTGFTGTASISGTTNGNLQVANLLAVQNGKLRLANGTARTLAVDADIQIGSGASFDVSGAGVAVTNNVTLGGSLTNNGTLDFNVGGKTANLSFTGSTNTNLTGPTGVLTNLYTLTVNKGVGRAAMLSMDVAGTLTTPTNSWLTLTNGTLRYAKAGTSTLTIHDAASSYLITDNAGLTVDAPNATVTVATNVSTAADLKLAGEVRVLQGTLSVGSTTGGGNDLEYASAGAPTLRITGGNLYVNGQVRRTVTNLDGSLRYDQSGGIVEIAGFGATAAQNNERGLFEVQGPGSIFRMTGGQMYLRRSNGRPTIAADFYLAPDSTVVTAGFVVLGNSLAGVGNVTVSVSSTVPLYNLNVESGANATNTNTGLLTGNTPLALKGSLKISNNNSYFNANGLGLKIDQDLINNNASASTALNAGGFQPSTTTQTTTFTGNGPALQQLTGAAGNLTVFGALVLNNAQTNGTLQLGGNALTAGTLTLAKGTLNDNGNTITALSDVLNSAVHTSSGSGSLTLGGTTNQNVGGNGLGKFGNLTLNNAAGATTTTNQEATNVLSIPSGVLTIGSNLLWLSNPGTALAGTFDATHFIRTNGIVADLGLRKSYPAAASNFTFPVGAAAKYTPVQMNVTGTSSAGTITVQPIDLAHPSTTDPLAKELKYFWKVSSTGLASTTVNQQFTYLAGDVNGTEANYKLGRFLRGAWNPLNGIAGSVVNATNHTLTNSGATYIDGDYTGGEVSEFGAVPTFYSRNATAGLTAGATWTNASAWTYNADGTDSGPLPSTYPTAANPTVIRPGHLLTTTMNGMGAATLKLDGTLDLGVNVANNFNTVSGTGTLKIGSALFPAGNYANFVAANTGTVEFTGAVQLPARDTYNNLTLSGGTTKQLTNLNLTLNGALNITTSTGVANPTSQNITLTSATSGATIAGAFTLNDGQLTTGAFLNTASTGSFSFGAGAVTAGTSLTNAGTLVNGSAPLTVATTFTNTGTFDASAATSTGLVAVGGDFSNTSSYTAGTGDLNVTGNITNTGTFTAGTGGVNAGLNFSNAGGYTAATNIMHVNGDYTNQATGFFDAANSNIVFRGNFTNTPGATFAPGTSLVQFITDVNRFINGNTTFYDLQKLSVSALTLGPSTTVHVANLMTIQNSVIFTGTNTGNTLYLDNPNFQPIVGNTLTSYVAGRLAMTLPNAAASIRVFPVGAGQRYRPVTIKTLGTSASAVVLVEIINGAAPGANSAGNVAATLQNIATTRYYRIQLLSGTIAQPTIQLSFNTDVEDEKVNVPGNLRVARSAGPNGQWDTAGGSGVYSPDAPKGYTTSAATTIDGTSFFVIASTNKVDNPLSGAAPLPVELITFSATRQGSAVQVAWATASEKNSAYFVVERSANGRTFDALTRVEAQGTSTARVNYGTLDQAPLGSTSYYRLRQVDKDGTTAYSNVATVRFEGKAGVPSLVAYPNPATGSGFQLATSNLAPTSGTVRVFDNVGRLVFTQPIAAGTAEATVQPAQPLASGMYFATWTTADGVKLTTKVSVE